MKAATSTRQLTATLVLNTDKEWSKVYCAHHKMKTKNLHKHFLNCQLYKTHMYRYVQVYNIAEIMFLKP